MHVKKGNTKSVTKGISQADRKADDVNFRYWLPVLIIIYAFIAYQKRPMAFLNPQFIAEDGVVFYQDAINEGFRSIFMINGTYHDFLIRICAFFTYITTDILYAPLMFNLLSSLIYVLCAVYIWFRVDENKVIRLAFTAIFLLAPYGAESYLWLTMIHFLTPVLLLIPFLYPRTSKKWLISDAIMIVVLGLTGANSALYLPVILLIFIARKQWHNKPLVILGSLFYFVGLFQLYNILSVDIDQRTLGQGEVIMQLIIDCTAFFLYNTFVSVLDGPVFFVYNPALHLLFLILLSGFLIYVSFKAYRGNEKYFKILVLLVTSILISISTIVAWKKQPYAILPPMNPATRYIATQTCMILFAIILLIQPRSRKWIYGMLVLFILSSFSVHNYYKQKEQLNDLDGKWAEVVAQYKRGEICELPILYVGSHSIKIKDCQVTAQKK